MRKPVEHSPTPQLSGNNNDILIKLRKKEKISKSALYFMALYRGVIFYFPRVNMHQKNSNHVGCHHVEGFQECSMYKADRYAKTIDTWDESPCSSKKPARRFS